MLGAPRLGMAFLRGPRAFGLGSGSGAYLTLTSNPSVLEVEVLLGARARGCASRNVVLCIVTGSTSSSSLSPAELACSASEPGRDSVSYLPDDADCRARFLLWLNPGKSSNSELASVSSSSSRRGVATSVGVVCRDLAVSEDAPEYDAVG